MDIPGKPGDGVRRFKIITIGIKFRTSYKVLCFLIIDQHSINRHYVLYVVG